MKWNQSFGTATYLLLLFALSAYAFKCVQELHQKLEALQAEEDQQHANIEELHAKVEAFNEKEHAYNEKMDGLNAKIQTLMANETQGHAKIQALSAKIKELTENESEITAKMGRLSAKAKKWDRISQFLDIPIFNKNNRYYKFMLTKEGLERIQCNAQGVAMSIVA